MIENPIDEGTETSREFTSRVCTALRDEGKMAWRVSCGAFVLGNIQVMVLGQPKGVRISHPSAMYHIVGWSISETVIKILDMLNTTTEA